MSSTRHARGASSTDWPLRASWYSRRPSRFSAEYMGGICSMSPTNRGSMARSSSSPTSTGRSATTWPVASWVSVSTPSLIRAT